MATSGEKNTAACCLDTGARKTFAVSYLDPRAAAGAAAQLGRPRGRIGDELPAVRPRAAGACAAAGHDLALLRPPPTPHAISTAQSILRVQYDTPALTSYQEDVLVQLESSREGPLLEDREVRRGSIPLSRAARSF